jgi:nitrite reductase (NADH) large subunit
MPDSDTRKPCIASDGEMKKQRLVVIGNGMAGGRFVEELLARNGGELFDIVVFGEEPHGNYNRILLSSVVAGSHEIRDIFLNSVEWYHENGVTLHSGVRVEAVDRARKVVIAANGIDEHYDCLVFATGSKPFVPPIEGLGRDGVFVFHTIEDALRIMEYAKHARKAVVLGGGLLGLEAARGLLNRGLEVHVVELMSHPMAVQLDPAAGRALQSTLEAMGIRFHLGKSIAKVAGNGAIESVTLNDGTTESCDLLVISAGIRPNVEVAKQAGLKVERAIVVGDDLASVDDPSIFAIGECAQHRGLTYGLVAPGSEQAKVLADRLSGFNAQAVYEGSNTSTTLKVMGMDLVVLGNKDAACETDEVLTYTDARRGTYKKVILRDHRLAGAILLGDVGIASRLTRAFHKQEPLRESAYELMFPGQPTEQVIIDEPPETFEENLKEVIAIIRPERWQKTRLRVESLGIFAYTQHRVVGRGRQRGLHFLARRGASSGTGFRYLPKRMATWIVGESQVEKLVEAIIEANCTGQIGDGKIFVLPINGAMQVGAERSDQLEVTCV